MTLAFTFPIKDAWVLVADKKAISKAKDRDENLEEISFFSDNTEKIKEIGHNLFFVGSGEQEILEKTIEIINHSKNFNEFKENIVSKIDELYGIFGEKIITNEEFLIINKVTQSAFKFEIKEIKKGVREGVHKLNSCFKNNFIGCYDNCKNLGLVKLEFSSLKNKSFQDIDIEFNNQCNRFLSLLSIDYSAVVGHPAIHGSDIWVINKNKIKKIITHPKEGYDYEVEDD